MADPDWNFPEHGIVCCTSGLRVFKIYLCKSNHFGWRTKHLLVFVPVTFCVTAIAMNEMKYDVDACPPE